MITYVIDILPFILELHADHPHITQLWYTDDDSAGGKFEALQEHIQKIMLRDLRGVTGTYCTGTYV